MSKLRSDRVREYSPAEYKKLLDKTSATDKAKLLELEETCRYSLRYFSAIIMGAWTTWKDFIHEEADLRYNENWHLLVWYRVMEEYTRACILCARGHGKTRAFSWTYPLWRMWKDPGSQGILFSNTEDQAGTNLDIIKRIIDHNRVLSSLRPARPKKWGAEEIRCENQSGLRVMGQGSSARGAHPDYIIEDDILDEKNSNTQDLREKVKNWHFSVVEPMLLGNAPLFIVGTPQAYDDLLMSLKDNSEYLWLRFPARIEEEDKDKLMRYL